MPELIPASLVKRGDIVVIPQLGKRTVERVWQVGDTVCFELKAEVLKWCQPGSELTEWITLQERQ